ERHARRGWSARGCGPRRPARPSHDPLPCPAARDGERHPRGRRLPPDPARRKPDACASARNLWRPAARQGAAGTAPPVGKGRGVAARSDARRGRPRPRLWARAVRPGHHPARLQRGGHRVCDDGPRARPHAAGAGAGPAWPAAFPSARGRDPGRDRRRTDRHLLLGPRGAARALPIPQALPRAPRRRRGPEPPPRTRGGERGCLARQLSGLSAYRAGHGRAGGEPPRPDAGPLGADPAHRLRGGAFLGRRRGPAGVRPRHVDAVAPCGLRRGAGSCPVPSALRPARIRLRHRLAYKDGRGPCDQMAPGPCAL
ncbi:MAG: hypothetical protein AVDCRST_MAG15-2723, partial [uncultured Rubellimicrobium sp.]